MNKTRNIHLPYAIEYGNNIKTCSVCNGTIGTKSLRICVCDDPYKVGDYYAPWAHFDCFLKKNESIEINAASISGLDRIKWEDQLKVRAMIQKLKAGYKSPEKTSEPPGSCLYLITRKFAQAATARGKCHTCSVNFRKKEIKVYSSAHWHHLKCLVDSHDRIYGTLEEMEGWNSVPEEEKEELKKIIEDVKEKFKEDTPKPSWNPLDDCLGEVEEDELANFTIMSDGGLVKKDVPSLPKKRVFATEAIKEEEEGEDVKRKKIVKKEKIKALKKEQFEEQATQLWALRKLFKKLDNHERNHVLRENDIYPINDYDQNLDVLVDIACFGCPELCEKCHDGRILYNSSQRMYFCTGYITEYSRCDFSSKNPKRKDFIMTYVYDKKHNSAGLEFNIRKERLYPKEEEIIKHSNLERRSILPAETFESNNKLQAIHNKPKHSHVLKNGTVVDARFHHANDCHVVKPYQVTLSMTDVAENVNSFFKIQMLKRDDSDLYYIFYTWGRVGTDFGGHDHHPFHLKSDAIQRFESMFFEKTHNSWRYRKFFRKLPGLFNYVETDFSDFEQLQDSEITPGSQSQLPKGVQDVVLAIFDVESMKTAMKSFNMDIDKMPLGRLSEKQINQAFEVLTELSEFITKGKQGAIEAVDATNKFYTLIPHNFGMDRPAPIDDLKKIHEKCQMLNSLLEIKFAFDQMQGGAENIRELRWKDPVDVNYEKLGCAMRPLDRGGDEWRIIEHYMRNTHGSTHQVHVDLIDILAVHRPSESGCFRRDLGNRRLLWHGSQRMNFAGILGQGLRIAPPEAPVNGYMFGKGIYFADMFTKSFFYTRATRSGEEVYMLLCDVALGFPFRHQAQIPNMCKANLPQGTHSVHAIGRECPHELGDVYHPEGYVIPTGPVKQQLAGLYRVHFHLLYNEYIVYDPNQVQIKYLVRLKVNHARHL